MNDNYYDYVAQALNKINFESNPRVIDYGIDEKEYKKIMNNILNLREYCRGRESCDVCRFADFCSVNFGDNDVSPGNLWIDGEEIICDG